MEEKLKNNSICKRPPDDEVIEEEVEASVQEVEELVHAIQEMLNDKELVPEEEYQL